MIVGEQQILGQVRTSLAEAQNAGNAGRALNELAQNSLRVGKRIHTDTGIDRHGASVVTVALDKAKAQMAPGVAQRALVVGAGAMSSLALQTLQTRGVPSVEVASRSAESSSRVAQAYGAQAIAMDDVFESLKSADLVVSATGATGVVLTAESVAQAMTDRSDRPLVVVDLALPHDTDPLIADLPGVTRIDLASLADLPGAAAPHADLIAAKTIIDGEVLTFIASQAAARVEPIVVSLRAKADLVLEAELERLRLKQPGLSEDEIAAVEQTLRRTSRHFCTPRPCA